MPTPRTRPSRWKPYWPELSLAGLIVLATGVYAAVSLAEVRRHPNLVVAAPAYVWQAGCPQRAYRFESRIPKRCRAGRYRLRNATELGLITHGRNNHWYRVGDDALLLNCFRLGDSCVIVDRVSRKFVRQ